MNLNDLCLYRKSYPDTDGESLSIAPSALEQNSVLLLLLGILNMKANINHYIHYKNIIQK